MSIKLLKLERSAAMKGVIASLLGTLVVFFCGCGGGGDSAGQSPTNSTQKPSSPSSMPRHITIDAEGDSQIWGYAGTAANGSYIQSHNNSVVILQEELQAQIGSTVAVQNNGSSGAKAIDSLDGTPPYYTQPFATRLAANSAAQFVLANYAVNDSMDRTIDQYAADLTNWIAVVRATGRTPVLEEPNPVCDQRMPNVGAYVAVMRNVAKQQSVTLIEQYDFIASLPNWRSMLIDCIHPSDILYKIKAHRAAAVLMPLVKSMQ